VTYVHIVVISNLFKKHPASAFEFGLWSSEMMEYWKNVPIQHNFEHRASSIEHPLLHFVLAGRQIIPTFAEAPAGRQFFSLFSISVTGT
jgi:hypothetical protein